MKKKIKMKMKEREERKGKGGAKVGSGSESLGWNVFVNYVLRNDESFDWLSEW
jgi:hypothetical protein